MGDGDRTRDTEPHLGLRERGVPTFDRMSSSPPAAHPAPVGLMPTPRMGVKEVAGYLAERFVDRLGLEACTIYLYDHRRLSLAEAAHCGSTVGPRPDASLEPGSSLAGFQLELGAPGGSFTLPLWDGHRLLGVVHGRMPENRELAEDTLGPAHWLVTGAGLAVSLALSAEGAVLPPRPGKVPSPGPSQAPHVLNRHLAGHLRGAFARANGGQVVLAMIRLGGPVRRGILPAKGVSLPRGAHASGGTCRGFGFGSGSSRIALVWQGTTEEYAREVLLALIQGRRSVSRLMGAGRAEKLSSTAVVAAAVSAYPADAGDETNLLGCVVDLLEAHSYLLTNLYGGVDNLGSLDKTGSIMIMDRDVLDGQISRLRQELKEAIAGGLSFGDAPVREISERLDRLIVVMQRLMGHRGAVT